MRAFVVISAIALALPVPATALTLGEVSREAVENVRTECGEALARHEVHWPDADAERDVVWRNEAFLNSTSEISAENPDLNAFLPAMTAWQMSGFALVDDLVIVSTFGDRGDLPPPNWLPRYTTLAEGLTAAIDVYDCTRLSDDEFNAVIATGVSAELLQTVAVFDCLAGLGRDMAGVFEKGGTTEAVYLAVVPLVPGIEECRRSGQ